MGYIPYDYVGACVASYGGEIMRIECETMLWTEGHPCYGHEFQCGGFPRHRTEKTILQPTNKPTAPYEPPNPFLLSVSVIVLVVIAVLWVRKQRHTAGSLLSLAAFPGVQYRPELPSPTFELSLIVLGLACLLAAAAITTQFVRHRVAASALFVLAMGGFIAAIVTIVLVHISSSILRLVL